MLGVRRPQPYLSRSPAPRNVALQHLTKPFGPAKNLGKRGCVISRDRRKSAFSRLIDIFGGICALIGLSHVIFGISNILGSVPVNAIMDSEHRFYATLFIGFGLAMNWCARDLGGRERPFQFPLAVFFVGGPARLGSVSAVGWPSPLFIFLGSL